MKNWFSRNQCSNLGLTLYLTPYAWVTAQATAVISSHKLKPGLNIAMCLLPHVRILHFTKNLQALFLSSLQSKQILIFGIKFFPCRDSNCERKTWPHGLHGKLMDCFSLVFIYFELNNEYKFRSNHKYLDPGSEYRTLFLNTKTVWKPQKTFYFWIIVKKNRQKYGFSDCLSFLGVLVTLWPKNWNSLVFRSQL
jgi:hypothetical protein